MREIKFRGQTRKKGEQVRMDGTPVDGNWVYGGVRQGKGDFSMIYENETYEKRVVYTDTICQYIGLKDKNGNKIWENDIVELYDTNNNYKWKAIVKFGNPNATYNWGYQLHPIGQYKVNTDILLWVEMEDTGTICEVIGNVFDNPELLERGAE